MRPLTAAVLAASLTQTTGALAQTAKENYSYTAPSGMFNDGTLKWQMFRFVHEERERMQGLTTGSVPATPQWSTLSGDNVGQPGRRPARRSR